MLNPQQLSQLKATGNPTVGSSSSMNDEQFSQWAGNTKPTSSNPSYINNISDAQVSAGHQIGSGVKQINQAGIDMNQGKVGTAMYNTVSGAGDVAMGALGGVTAPISAAMKSVGDIGVGGIGNNKPGDTIGGNIMKNGIQPIADAVVKHTGLQGVLTKYPGLEKDIPNILGVALSFLGGEKAPEIKGAVSGGVDTGLGALKAGSEALDQTASKVKESIFGTPEQQLVKENASLQKTALQDATPSYNKNIVGEPAIRNPDGTLTPRVSEAKGLSQRTVNSTPSEIASGNELSKIPEYKDLVKNKATNLEKAQIVDNAIANKGKALDTSLANEKILRPPKELNKVIRTAVMDTADRSQLLSKSDPVVKNYLRSSQRIVNATDGTLAGERQVVLKLDQAYEDAGGKYANNKPLDQIHRSARQSLINDMESKAQNTQVKASLREMQNLYNANDTLWDKAKAEGGSKFEQFVHTHPILSKITKAGVRATGLDAGLHLLP